MNSKEFIRNVAWRYFRSHRSSERLISIVSTISIIGVTIGCLALIITLSVLNGFRSEITERLTQFEAALKMEQFPMSRARMDTIMAWAEAQPEIGLAVPAIERKAMLTTEEGTEVVYVKALDLQEKTYPLESQIIGGKFHLGESNSGKVVLGYQLADQLGVTVGDTLAIMSPLEMRAPFYNPPVIRTEVSGVYRADLFQYDQAYAFVGISAGQDLFRLDDKYTTVELFAPEFELAAEMAVRAEDQSWRNVTISTWQERHQTLYGAMNMEKWGSFIALTLIILVAIFNLVSSLVMLVLEKIRDIGILKTMGATNAGIRKIFLRQGWYVGGIGTTIGIALGILIVFVQEWTGVVPLPSDVYFIDAVPVQLQIIDVVSVALVSILLSLLSAVYPARQAANLQPIEAISYDR